MPEKSILIVFPHGIGDFIMATPAFREMRKRFPEAKIGIAVQSRPWSSGQVHRCPYFDEVYLIHNPWLSRDYSTGKKIVEQQVSDIQEVSCFDEVCYMWLYQTADSPRGHKVEMFADLLNVDISDDRYEIYVDKNAETEAEKWAGELGLSGGKYAFIHTQSSDMLKNSAANLIRKAAREKYGSKIFEVGREFETHRTDIATSFALMRNAGYVGLVDSVFVHAADALGIDIDVHATTPAIEAANRPLHSSRLEIIHHQAGFWRTSAVRLLVKMGPARFTVPQSIRRVLRITSRARVDTDDESIRHVIETVNRNDGDRILIKDWSKVIDGQNVLLLPVILELRLQSGSWVLRSADPLAPITERTSQLFRAHPKQFELLSKFVMGGMRKSTSRPGSPDVLYSSRGTGELKQLNREDVQPFTSVTGVFKNTAIAVREQFRSVSKSLERIRG